MIEKEGPGWRLARDEQRNPFPVLLGGENWACELTDQEWSLLVPLVFELIGEYQKVQKQLCPEEDISMELERLPWWACIDGNRDAWNLRLVLEGDREYLRGLEMFWPMPSAEAITSAMRTMWDSYN